MNRPFIAAALAAAALVVPATAHAATKSCPSFTADNGVRIVNLKATNLAAKTNDYMPACGVARAVADLYMFKGTSKIRVMGARWDAGTWRVRPHHIVDGPTLYTATQGSKRVTFTGVS